MTNKEEVLREFGEWIKTQPIYVGGGITDREILVIRNRRFESAIEAYLKEKEQEEFYPNGYKEGYGKCVTCKFKSCNVAEKPCRECCHAWADMYKEAENDT